MVWDPRSLISAAPLTGAEEFDIRQGGAQRRTTTGAVGALTPAGPTGPTGPTGPAGPAAAVSALLTPLSGGGQVGATQLAYGFNPIVGSYSSNDSVQLPLAIAGNFCMFYVVGGLSNTILALYGKEGSSDTINGNSGNTQFDFWNNVGGTLPMIGIATCSDDGAWYINCVVD